MVNLHSNVAMHRDLKSDPPSVNLHSNGAMHRDLKSDMVAKRIDCGLSKFSGCCLGCC